jgi:hypothetical protein
LNKKVKTSRISPTTDILFASSNDNFSFATIKSRGARKEHL